MLIPNTNFVHRQTYLAGIYLLLAYSVVIPGNTASKSYNVFLLYIIVKSSQNLYHFDLNN